jgi:small subunit ribosomal protein S11
MLLAHSSFKFVVILVSVSPFYATVYAGCQQTAGIAQLAAVVPYGMLRAAQQSAAAQMQCSNNSPWRSYSSSSSSDAGSSSSSSSSEAGANASAAGSSSSDPASAASAASSQQQQAAAPPAQQQRWQQQPAAAYGPRKVTPRSGQAAAGAGPAKREGIVHVNSTFNNTIMVLTDRDSKVQTWTSGGTVGYKNANKATPMAAELAAKELAKRAIGLGFHSVVVKLKGMGKNKQFAVQSLAANGLTVSQLQDVTPIPYNGCRLPRRRRV